MNYYAIVIRDDKNVYKDVKTDQMNEMVRGMLLKLHKPFGDMAAISIYNSQTNSFDDNIFPLKLNSFQLISEKFFDILAPVQENKDRFLVYENIEILLKIIKEKKSFQMSFRLNQEFHFIENANLILVVKNIIGVYFAVNLNEKLPFPFPTIGMETMICIPADKFFSFIDVTTISIVYYQNLLQSFDWKENLLQSNYFVNFKILPCLDKTDKDNNENEKNTNSTVQYTGTIPKIKKIDEKEKLDKLQNSLSELKVLYNKESNLKYSSDDDSKISEHENLHTTPASANFEYIKNSKQLEKISPIEYYNDKYTCHKCDTDIEHFIKNGILISICKHIYCLNCANSLLEKNNSDDKLIPCPYKDCSSLIQYQEIVNIMQELSENEEENSTEANEIENDIFHCKTENCEGAWFIKDIDCRLFKCNICNHFICIDCQAIHEGKSCEEYKNKNRRKNKKFSKNNKEQNQINKKQVDCCHKIEEIYLINSECNHLYCIKCLKHNVNPSKRNRCLVNLCNKDLDSDILLTFFSEEEMEFNQKIIERQKLAENEDCYCCTNKNCTGFWFINTNSNENYYECPLCKQMNCISCQVIHEGFKNCKTFQNNVCKTRDPKHDAVRRQWDEIFNDKRVFCCPNCQLLIFKLKNSNFVFCAICRENVVNKFKDTKLFIFKQKAPWNANK